MSRFDTCSGAGTAGTRACAHGTLWRTTSGIDLPSGPTKVGCLPAGQWNEYPSLRQRFHKLKAAGLSARTSGLIGSDNSWTIMGATVSTVNGPAAV